MRPMPTSAAGPSPTARSPAKTDVVTNGTDDQGLAAIGIDDRTTRIWWVVYVGKSDGSETWNTAVNLYCKVSTRTRADMGSRRR